MFITLNLAPKQHLQPEQVYGCFKAEKTLNFAAKQPSCFKNNPLMTQNDSIMIQDDSKMIQEMTQS